MRATTEVKVLVASFLLDSDELVGAKVYNPDVWRGVTAVHWHDTDRLLGSAPVGACRVLLQVFEQTQPITVAYWTARRGFAIKPDVCDASWGFPARQCLYGACAGGQVHLLRELKPHMGSLPPHAASYAVHSAAEYGHADVIAELRTWGLSAEHARTNGGEALRLAAEHGHAGVLAELRDHWAFTGEEVRALNLTDRQLRAAKLVWPALALAPNSMLSPPNSSGPPSHSHPTPCCLQQPQ